MKTKWLASELNEFVKIIDEMGGIASSSARAATQEFFVDDINYTNLCNGDINPLSKKYNSELIKIYELISGKVLDQWSNERTIIPDNRLKANPYGINDIYRISKHCRTIFNMMLMANLQPGSKVLDMGAGWGLSTEMMAYTGAKVTALDINLDFTNLINYRSKPRNLDITTINKSFDDFDLGETFDVIFFYECLHHCSDVEKLIRKCRTMLHKNGKIIFAGEPITSMWWGRGYWGMRLDAESVYVMRKFGWFETGWSEEYLKNVFGTSGFNLKLIQGIGLDHGYIGFAMREEEFKNEILNESISLTVPPHWPPVI